MQITNTDTGLQRKTLSNDVGYYGFPAVAPGAYRLTAQKEGSNCSTVMAFCFRLVTGLLSI
jgi:hypothetical protein